MGLLELMVCFENGGGKDNNDRSLDVGSARLQRGGL